MAGRDYKTGVLKAGKGISVVTQVSLSRWTLSWFWTALALLVVALVLMSVGYGYPFAGSSAPRTLVVVHLTGLGWLTFLMTGALFQFVPVLTAHPLQAPVLVLPALIVLFGGLMSLLAGFLHLDEVIPAPLPWFALSACLVSLGLILAAISLGATLWSARPLPLPARFVAVGLCSLAATAAFGSVFALAFSDAGAPRWAAPLVGAGLPLHIIAGLGGWLSFTAMGVSYRLLSMFMLAPEPTGLQPRAVLLIGGGALAVGIGLGAICLLAGYSIRPLLAFAGLLGAIAILLYGIDILRLYRKRLRRRMELNSRVALAALASAGAATVTGVFLALTYQLMPQMPAVLFLVAFGWLSGLGLAKLYKIVPFLTWLEAYGPVLGKGTCPRVQDLVNETRAQWWFGAYFVGVATGTLSLLIGWNDAFRASAVLMLAAVLAIAGELVRARRLAEVSAENRLPDTARRPPLFHARARDAAQQRGDDHAGQLRRA